MKIFTCVIPCFIRENCLKEIYEESCCWLVSTVNFSFLYILPLLSSPSLLLVSPEKRNSGLPIKSAMTPTLPEHGVGHARVTDRACIHACTYAHSSILKGHSIIAERTMIKVYSVTKIENMYSQIFIRRIFNIEYHS